MLFGKKRAIKQGKLFLVEDIIPRLKRFGMSSRHCDEHFAKHKYMTWEEVDTKMKMLGHRHNIQDVIGLPPEMRITVQTQEKQLAKQAKEEAKLNQKLKYDEKKYEILEEKQIEIRRTLVSIHETLDVVQEKIDFARATQSIVDKDWLKEKANLEKEIERVSKTIIKVSDREIQERIEGVLSRVESRIEDVSMQDYLKSIPTEMARANKELRINQENAEKERMRRAELAREAQMAQKPRYEEPKKPAVVSDDDLSWLKSIPSELDKARDMEARTAKMSNVAEDFKHAGGGR